MIIRPVCFRFSRPHKHPVDGELGFGERSGGRHRERLPGDHVRRYPPHFGARGLDGSLPRDPAQLHESDPGRVHQLRGVREGACCARCDHDVT